MRKRGSSLLLLFAGELATIIELIQSFTMSRPVRLEYPGAWYHVMNRGRRREDIFLSRHDFAAFINILQETADAWNLRIAAYCLMTNHYHLLVHTPEVVRH